MAKALRGHDARCDPIGWEPIWQGIYFPRPPRLPPPPWHGWMEWQFQLGFITLPPCPYVHGLYSTSNLGLLGWPACMDDGCLGLGPALHLVASRRTAGAGERLGWRVLEKATLMLKRTYNVRLPTYLYKPLYAMQGTRARACRSSPPRLTLSRPPAQSLRVRVLPGMEWRRSWLPLVHDLAIVSSSFSSQAGDPRKVWIATRLWLWAEWRLGVCPDLSYCTATI